MIKTGGLRNCEPLVFFCALGGISAAVDRNMSRETSSRGLLLHGGALGDCLLAYHLLRNIVHNPSRDLFIVARNSVHRWLAQRGLIAGSAFTDDCGVTSLYLDRPRLSGEVSDWIADCGLIVNMIDSPGCAVERNLTEATSGRVISIDPRSDASSEHIVVQWAVQLNRGVSKLEEDTISKIVFRSKTDQLTVLNSLRCPLNPAPASDFSGSLNVIIHAGSGGVRKCAPLEWLEAVANGLTNRNISTAWMIGPDEAERDGPTLRRRLEVTAPVIMEPDICVAADRIAGANVFVGNDSGMAHLAALCGIRTIVWFGPTDPDVWRPIGPDVHDVFDTEGASFIDRVMHLADSANHQNPGRKYDRHCPDH